MCVNIGSVSHCGMVLVVCGGTRKNTSTEVRTGRFQQRNLVSQGFFPSPSQHNNARNAHHSNWRGNPFLTLCESCVFVRRHAESVCRLWEWQRDPPHCCATMQLAISPCLPSDACCLHLLVTACHLLKPRHRRLSPTVASSPTQLSRDLERLRVWR